MSGARRDDVQAPPRVEHVAEGQQVVLVRAAAVVEHEQPLRLAGGGRQVELEPLDLGDEAAEREDARGARPARSEPERVGHDRAL